ncbi:MAG: hypothetical protein AAB971_04175 [Patescibacteria group bacterium]
MKILDNVDSAERILVSKGSDNLPCVNEFQAISGIEIPTFRGEELKATSQGREFWLVKGRDIPKYLAKKWGDIGIAGTDVYLEYADSRQVDCQSIGQSMYRFSLLAEPQKVSFVEARLNTDGRYPSYPTSIPTGLPKLLMAAAQGQDLPFQPLEMPISDSVEAAIGLSGVGIGADIVFSGETARQNGLLEVFKLRDIYPAIMMGRDL